MPTLNLQIAADADDNSGCTAFGLLSATVLISGFYVASGFRVFTRFTNVTIPQGSTITSADYQLNASDTTSATTYDSNIYCNNVDNASNPANGTDLDALSLTTAFTSIAGQNTISGNWYSFDITSAVQEIVNRGGFTSGNAITVLVVNNGSTAYRRWNDYSNSTVNAAKLDIIYTAPVPPSYPENPNADLFKSFIQGL